MPRVWLFQRARVDLGGARGFPDAFYCAEVASIIATRCEAAVQAAAAKSKLGAAPPQLRFGDDCTICLAKIATVKRGITELPCGHSFHSPCIEEWLRCSSLCPNCRAPAHDGCADSGSMVDWGSFRSSSGDRDLETLSDFA